MRASKSLEGRCGDGEGKGVWEWGGEHDAGVAYLPKLSRRPFLVPHAPLAVYIQGWTGLQGPACATQATIFGSDVGLHGMGLPQN